MITTQSVSDDWMPQAHGVPRESRIGVEPKRRLPGGDRRIGHELHLVGTRVVAREPHLLERDEAAGELLDAREALRQVDLPPEGL